MLTKEMFDLIIAIVVIAFVISLISTILISFLSTKKNTELRLALFNFKSLKAINKIQRLIDVYEKLFDISLVISIITMIIIIALLFLHGVYKQGHF